MERKLGPTASRHNAIASRLCTWITSRWNVVGAFFIPKDITLYWYRPFGVAKAETSFARSLKGIYQNPFNKSNFETYVG